jgi:hypothetical protein
VLPSFLRGAFESFSDHVVYTSSLYGDLRSQVTEMGSSLIDLEREPRSDADRRCRRVAECIRPFDTGQTLVRVGGDADGAYVMADDFHAAAAISVGVGHDVSWDMAMASHGVPVHMFDPTVQGPPSPVPSGTFHPIGIGTSAQAERSGLDLRPLDALAAMVDTPEHADLILKIDVEGAEWEALAAAASLDRYRQIVLELHDLEQLADSASGIRIVSVLERLNETHVSVHAHANNDAPLAHFDAYWLPSVLEVSYVRRDLATTIIPATSMREDLDRPSNPRFADLSLRGLLSL